MNTIGRFALLAIAVLVFVPSSFAAVYTVTKVTDTNDGTCDADCSLREAVAAAGATPDDDIIQFALPLFASPQTITLAGSDIIVNNGGPLRIFGPGANRLTISGNNASRILTNNTGATTIVMGIRFTGGNASSSIQSGRGGAIYNNGGNLTLSNVVITGNSATNGGGLNNAGTATLTLIDSVVSNNTATGAGGGMQNFSGNTFNIFNSTVTANTSSSTLTGGGAMQANGVVNITNSTFSGNTANGGSGGAFYYNGTGLTMTNATIANNTSTSGSGGFHKATTTNNANIRNSIFAGNSVADASGLVNSLGTNVIKIVGTSTGWITSDLQNVDPLIAPLGFYGGFGMTHALMSTSPAINAGQNCVVDVTCSSNNPAGGRVTADQRGALRPSGSAVDIGAFEASNEYVATLPSAAVGSPYIFTLVPAASGFTYSVASGSFGAVALSSGTSVSLSGTPPQPAVHSAVVQISGGGNSTAAVNYRLNALADLRIVSIDGRVMSNDGTALSNLGMRLVNRNGVVVATARSSSFGYFRFDGVEAAQVHFVEVISKTHQFLPPGVLVTDVVSDLIVKPPILVIASDKETASDGVPGGDVYLQSVETNSLNAHGSAIQRAKL